MIKLKVEDYCHDCPMFEAHVTTYTGRTVDGLCGNVVINCEYKNACDNIKRYLERTACKTDVNDDVQEKEE